MKMDIKDIILKKRDGQKLNKREIDFFITAYTAGIIPDYQASALLMAIFFNKLDDEETFLLTEAMKNSGESYDLSKIEGIKVDKHSTGGVGDKTTLIIAPIAAAAGVKIAKMSGRGLGFTGGTADKLESIPGMNLDLTNEEFRKQVNEIGIALATQSEKIAPADKKLYMLRDSTQTVENISLIASSIMSKKLAQGSDAILLDVKCGDGAFAKTKEEAQKLADIMTAIGEKAGKKMQALITDMNQPLGYCIGNNFEIIEVIEILKGKDVPDLCELSLTLAGHMIYMGEKAETHEEGRKIAKEVLESGKAYEKFKELVEYQGGDVDYIENPVLFDEAKYKLNIRGPGYGKITEIRAREIGIASQLTGAGRQKKEDEIDFSAGIKLFKKVGDEVVPGDLMAIVYSNDSEKIKKAAATAAFAFTLSSQG